MDEIEQLKAENLRLFREKADLQDKIAGLEHDVRLYRKNCEYWMDQYSKLHNISQFMAPPAPDPLPGPVAEHQTDPRLGGTP